jgi:streptogramin lyase
MPNSVSRPTRFLSILCALVAAVFLAVVATAVAAPEINGAFPLKSEVDGGNDKIVAGPEGNMWLTLNDATQDVAKVSPSGAIEEFDLGVVERPTGIAVGPHNELWVTATNKAVKFSPTDPKGTAKAFTLADIGATSSIVKGPDNNMWVATSEKVVRFSADNPEGTVKPFPVENLAAHDIDVAGQLLVIADGSMEKERILTMTTDGVAKETKIGGGSQGVAGAPDGQIGFSEQVPNGGNPEQVGTFVPPNPAQLKTQPDDPFGAAYGSDEAFWIARAGMNGGLARLTKDGQLTLLNGLPAKVTARQIAAGPNNTLWILAEKGTMEPGVVIRVTGLEPPPVLTTQQPETVIAKGPKRVVRTRRPKAKVTFTFRSTVASSSFECALVTVPKPRKGRKAHKAPKPSFKPCSSPRTYRLHAGSYRFYVQASAVGQTDPTAATRSFRVVRLPARHKQAHHKRAHR